mmetsp:Transcript_49793/g.144786  ORF Transcript_49793/g.144786 Transcript_49793/m.144786 type:complete len:485 (+) Transcript_49793:487-1941(+)
MERRRRQRARRRRRRRGEMRRCMHLRRPMWLRRRLHEVLVQLHVRVGLGLRRLLRELLVQLRICAGLAALALHATARRHGDGECPEDDGQRHGNAIGQRVQRHGLGPPARSNQHGAVVFGAVVRAGVLGRRRVRGRGWRRASRSAPLEERHLVAQGEAPIELRPTDAHVAVGVQEAEAHLPILGFVRHARTAPSLGPPKPRHDVVRVGRGGAHALPRLVAGLVLAAHGAAPTVSDVLGRSIVKLLTTVRASDRATVDALVGVLHEGCDRRSLRARNLGGVTRDAEGQRLCRRPLNLDGGAEALVDYGDGVLDDAASEIPHEATVAQASQTDTQIIRIQDLDFDQALCDRLEREVGDACRQSQTFLCVHVRLDHHGPAAEGAAATPDEVRSAVPANWAMSAVGQRPVGPLHGLHRADELVLLEYIQALLAALAVHAAGAAMLPNVSELEALEDPNALAPRSALPLLVDHALPRCLVAMVGEDLGG